MKKRYFNSIDGLRFLASLNIVLYHFEMMGGLNDLQGSPSNLFIFIKAPMFHASLFFILAGFIFTVKYSNYKDEFSTFAFLKSRFKQLYPLHIITVFALVPFVFLKGEYIARRFWDSISAHLAFIYPFNPHYFYDFNMPSWALGALFFCYIFFKRALVFVNLLNSNLAVSKVLLLLSIPTFLWGLLFIKLGSPNNLYPLFHMFPPIRFIEFFVGMLIARLFLLRDSSNTDNRISNKWFVNDGYIILLLIVLWNIISHIQGSTSVYRWYSYHFITPIIFAALLYRLAKGNGVIAKLMALPIIRDLGKSSFYPYLLHIPLMAWLCYILEHKFGYNSFLHHTYTLGGFIIVLYGVSTIYTIFLRRRSPSKFMKDIN